MASPLLENMRLWEYATCYWIMIYAGRYLVVFNFEMNNTRCIPSDLILKKDTSFQIKYKAM